MMFFKPEIVTLGFKEIIELLKSATTQASEDPDAPHGQALQFMYSHAPCSLSLDLPGDSSEACSMSPALLALGFGSVFRPQSRAPQKSDLLEDNSHDSSRDAQACEDEKEESHQDRQAGQTAQEAQKVEDEEEEEDAELSFLRLFERNANLHHGLWVRPPSDLLFCGHSSLDGGFCIGTDNSLRVPCVTPYRDRLRCRSPELRGLVEHVAARCEVIALAGAGRHPQFPASHVYVWATALKPHRELVCGATVVSFRVTDHPPANRHHPLTSCISSFFPIGNRKTTVVFGCA